MGKTRNTDRVTGNCAQDNAVQRTPVSGGAGEGCVASQPAAEPQTGDRLHIVPDTALSGGDDPSTTSVMKADASPNPFDPARLGISQDFASQTAVKRVLTRIRCDKPERHDFVRARPGPEWRLATYLLDVKGSQDKPGQETYLVQPEFVPELAGDIRPALLLSAVNRQNVPFLWRCWLPSSDGRKNVWTDTMLDAARLAERNWIRVSSGAGQYEIFQAEGQLPEPEWPDLRFSEWLRLAFQDRNIDSLNHPVVRALRGLA